MSEADQTPKAETPKAETPKAETPKAIRFTWPAPGTLPVALRLIAVVVVAGLLAQLAGGTSASLTVGLAAGSAMTFGVLMTTRAAVAVTLMLGVAAGLGAAAYGNALWSGLAVTGVVLLTAPATAYSAGMLMLAPLLTMLYTVSDRGFTWWQAAGWGVVGGLVGLVTIALMKFGKSAPKPLPWGLAWRHAVVLSLSVGLSILVAEALSLPHGYWVAVTLLVALRPIPGERSSFVTQRIWGTLVGSAVALITVWLLPANLLMVAAIVYLIALAAYAMSGNYFLQTVFLTPMLMIFLSASQKDAAVELTLERTFFTIVGVLLAVILARLMGAWDERSGLLDPDEESTPA